MKIFVDKSIGVYTTCLNARLFIEVSYFDRFLDKYNMDALVQQAHSKYCVEELRNPSEQFPVCPATILLRPSRHVTCAPAAVNRGA